MKIANHPSMSFVAKLPLILQAESTECGLACIAMILNYLGHKTSLAELRRKFSISLKGATLSEIIKISGQLELNTRALKLELEDLDQLRLPCILHWNLNHFVVLKSVSSKFIKIHDPALGECKLTIREVSECFTGVALELWPNPKFVSVEAKPSISLFKLMGNVLGLKRSFAQILVLAISLQIISLISPLFLQLVIDNAILSADIDLLATLAIGFLLLKVIEQITIFARSWIITYLGATISLQWRSNVFFHLIRLPIDYFEKRHVGDIVSRFGTIDQIQKTLTTSFIEGVVDGLMALITLILMWVYSPTLTVIVISAMTLYIVSRYLWYLPLRTATEEQIIHSAKQHSHFLETVRGMKAIKLFQRQDERHSIWSSLHVDQINADLKTQKLHFYYKLINGLIFGVEGILTLWLGAKFVIEGVFTIGFLLAFVTYKGQFSGSVGSLIDKYFDLKMLQLHSERLSDIVLTESEDVFIHHVENISAVAPPITLKDVKFRYSENEPFILDGVNCKIDSGESVAIVGPSGCGKTTLANLILGILSPVEGCIYIGEQKIEQYGIDRFRALVGTVTQDDSLFAGSIADNICFFDPNIDMAWVKKCAELAAISREIEAMPMQYNSLIGDMGTILSGGQKQRVLLARALYRRPKILVLDEATSHLDIVKESEVNAAIRELKITRLIIAHRPETIASASHVLRFEDGKVLGEAKGLAADC